MTFLCAAILIIQLFIFLVTGLCFKALVIINNNLFEMMKAVQDHLADLKEILFHTLKVK